MSLRRVDALAVVGPTASGKTAAALALADALQPAGGAEIISLDSALVYRGMDIGTAKPDRQELARVPHHLIDIIDPLQSYSAAEFVRDATRLMHEIRARGCTPLIVGGTMLYLKALLEGLDDMPPSDPAVRAGLQQKAQAQGWPALHAQLQAVDPVTAQRLAPGDSQRIGRALEVWALTGKPLSAFQQGRTSVPPPWQIPVISLEPADRAWLHERIARRFDAMLAAGFLQEVRTLRARGDLAADLPSMRCVGYRQAWQGLDEGWSEAAIRERGIFATRQLAKRQLTWLRGMPQRTVVPADAPDAQAQLVRTALVCLQTSV
jgi:tRNA dimethylallyltransferase